MARIKFDIPDSVKAKVTVYDILGKEVARVIDTNLKPGSYEIDNKNMKLPKGAYYLKLETEGFTKTKKILIVK